jgi:hypothetical protein
MPEPACLSDSRRGFGLDIGSTDHFQVVTTNNYNTITDFHTSPITPAHAKSLQSTFTNRFLATDFNTVTISFTELHTPNITVTTTHKSLLFTA